MRYLKTTLINTLVISGILMLQQACTNTEKQYTKDNSSITIKIPGKDSSTTTIKLTPVNKDIIHVVASQNNTLPSKESIAVISQDKFTDWQVEQNEDIITLSTANISVDISTTSGQLVFKDAEGKTLLKELADNSKFFSSSEIEGKYAIRQVFESPEDEAFYGLGQHQHGFMNYKGKDVELAQHNLVAVVPFLYSNKNYGILWDNYSITRFGDPREYSSIASLNLFDKDGQEGGLTATFYVDDKILKTETHNDIDYRFLETEAHESIPKEVNEKGKIVWEGSFSSKVAGTHKFLLYGSNYFKLWIDGKLIMDKWRQNWNPWSNPFFVDMTAGEKHSIKIEWIPLSGYMGLHHLDPLSDEEQNRLSLYSEVADAIDYYFVKGDNADEVISGYRTLTGKAPIVPKWAMGFWQSRERYKTQEELLNVVKTFREKEIPLDNIVLDWNYWPSDKWGSHKFDSTRFPDPKGMVDKVHEMNTNIMISVWPKFYPETENGIAMREKGYLFENNLEKKRLDWIWPGYENTFYDAFNPGARKMFWDQINEQLHSKGFDAWWLDATEPDMHSNLSIEDRKENMTPNYLGTGAEYFNAFSIMNSKGIYEEQRKAFPNKRVFILTRSAFAGQQRYGAVTWSGDVVTRWSDLRDQISSGINFCLSGIPYWTMDIGGFAVENRYGAYGDKPTSQDMTEWRELNVRWYQFGTFCPLFRVHGQFPFREVYNLAPEDHPAYQSMVYYNNLRYQLMPYIYTLAGKAFHDDYTIMRGLVMDFGNDKAVLDIDDQFMFGPSLLINPIYKFKTREREVYLPSSVNWYDFYTGEKIKGGQRITSSAPLEKIPIYVKEGAIIPTGVPKQFTGEKPDTLITLYVYGGQDGSFNLYADQATNYAYEKGAYTSIPILYKEASQTLTIGDRKGEYEGMVKKQTFQVIFINAGNNIGFNDEVETPQVIHYNGKAVSIQLK